jgi:CheY-like chemotaxis protein/HPt (histidine-containing phosphotransfer) domain-containing protein
MEPHSGSKGIHPALFFTRPVSVLLVDDNRVNQFLGKRILQNLGISNVEIAGNGLEAFNMVISNNYDVLLTDVEMPGMTGHELSKAIRSYEGTGIKIIIIALTANASDEDRTLATEAGIDGYLTKPYSPQDLQEILQKFLPVRESLIMEDIVVNVNPSSSDSINSLYAVFNKNKDDIRQFLHMLSGQIPTLVNQIKEGILAEKWDEAFQAAHKLKSPVKMLAGSELVDQLTELNEFLREKKDLKSIPSRFEAMAPALESLLVLVNKELESLD